MAFKNDLGMSISYECSELIDELMNDIYEFGSDTTVYVWCVEKDGVTLYCNYDFIEEEIPISENEILEEETLIKMTMGHLLDLLDKQNKIF